MSKRTKKGQNGRHSLIRDIADAFEVYPGSMCLEMNDRSRILLHGVTEIIEYSDSRIMLATRSCTVLIVGIRLSFNSYVSGSACVEGGIKSIEFGGE